MYKKIIISLVFALILGCQQKSILQKPKLSKELQQEYIKPLNGLWYINGIIGKNFQDTIKLKKTQLVKIAKNEYRPYGTTISIEEGVYEDSYGAPCGNDCFPSSKGNFTMISENKLTIFVKEFNQTGDCEEIHKTLNKNLGIYTLEKISDTQLKLVKNK